MNGTETWIYSIWGNRSRRDRKRQYETKIDFYIPVRSLRIMNKPCTNRVKEANVWTDRQED